MKLVVGVLGSPRKGGNTDILLGKALEGARSKGARTKKIILNNLDFRPCQACGGCDKTGLCVIRDDMRGIYDTLNRADGIAVASPVFFGTISAQLKTMIDRFQCFWIAKNVLKNKRAPRQKIRRGIFLCTASSERPDFFENSAKIVRNLFATLDIEYAGGLFCPGLIGKSDIVNKKGILASAFRLGVKLAG